MIFDKDMRALIYAGEKTMTRRVAKWDRDFDIPKPCTYTVGNGYSVQPGRGQKTLFRLRILAVRLEQLGTISSKDARAEGLRSVADFKLKWIQLHDAAWLRRLTKKNGVEPIVTEQLARFAERHAKTMVWVLSFEIEGEDDRALWLAKDAGTGYTQSLVHGLVDAGQVLDLDALKDFNDEAELLDGATYDVPAPRREPVAIDDPDALNQPLSVLEARRRPFAA